MAAVVGRSARTASDPAWPGRSSATTVCDRVNRSPKEPQSRPVWVKPCSSTSGGPSPRISTWSGTPGERTGHLQRHPGGRVGSPGRDRRRHLSGLAVHPSGPAAGRAAAGARAPGRAQRRVLRAGAGPGVGPAHRGLRDERDGRRRASPRRGGGAPCLCAADRLHGRPAAGAPRDGRATDDRPGGALHDGDTVGGLAGGAHRGSGAHVAAAGGPGVRRVDPGAPRARAGAPQPRLPRALDRRGGRVAGTRRATTVRRHGRPAPGGATGGAVGRARAGHRGRPVADAARPGARPRPG